jgi:hypothetical protein
MPDIHNKRNVVKEETTKMMDHERQERDLQKIFDATQASYLRAVENTFALQKRTLEFARNLMETSAETLETQADNNRATLETLTEESEKHREAMENLVRESSEVYESLLRSPFSHHQPDSKFKEATEASEVKSTE